MNVRINAYLLAADPAWIEASVLSYYPYVNRIVVSYDVDGLGWTGTPIPVDEVLERLRTLDVDNKMQYVSGRFSGTNQDLMQCDTTQRQAALESAGEGAD